jgi:hypothetical protein
MPLSNLKIELMNYLNIITKIDVFDELSYNMIRRHLLLSLKARHKNMSLTGIYKTDTKIFD